MAAVAEDAEARLDCRDHPPQLICLPELGPIAPVRVPTPGSSVGHHDDRRLAAREIGGEPLHVTQSEPHILVVFESVEQVEDWVPTRHARAITRRQQHVYVKA